MPIAQDIPAKFQSAVLDNLKQGQELTLGAVNAFVDAAANITPEKLQTVVVDGLPTPTVIVKQWFDFSEKVLAAQRDFAEKLVSAATPTTPAPRVKVS